MTTEAKLPALVKSTSSFGRVAENKRVCLKDKQMLTSLKPNISAASIFQIQIKEARRGVGESNSKLTVQHTYRVHLVLFN